MQDMDVLPAFCRKQAARLQLQRNPEAGLEHLSFMHGLPSEGKTMGFFLSRPEKNLRKIPNCMK